MNNLNKETMSRDINLTTFFYTVMICCALVWVISFLPSRYYFQFSTVADDGGGRGSLLLAGPDLPILDVFCSNVLQERREDYASRPVIASECLNYQRQKEDISSIFVPADANVAGVAVFPAEMRDATTQLYGIIHETSKELKSRPSVEEQSAGSLLEKLSKNQIDEKLRIIFNGAENESSNTLDEDAEINQQVQNVDAESASPALTLKEQLVDAIYGQTTQTYDQENIISIVKKEFNKDGRVERFINKYRSAYADFEISRNDEIDARENIYKSDTFKNTTFQVYSFMMERDNFVFAVSIVLKLLPALIAGLVMATASQSRIVETVPVATAFVAFVFCWPVVMLWDQAVDPAWQSMKGFFLIMYTIYILMYYFAGRLGVKLGVRLTGYKTAVSTGITINWSSIFSDSIKTLATGIASALLTWFVTSPNA